MENPQTPETLEAENPGEKTPKEASGSSCMSENCSGLAPVSDISMEAKMVEIEFEKIKDGEIEKGSLVNNDCVDRAKEEKMDSNMLPSCKRENEAKLGLKGTKSKGNLMDLGRDGNEDDGVEMMVQDEGISEDKQLESNGMDLSRKIEVSTEGISLFVEINGSPSKGKINEDRDEEQGENVGNRERGFSVGDIVWVQTKNLTWWPGKIHDPVDVPKYATGTGRGDNLLVGYYGISHFAWCRPSQLKPFHENFEQVSGENKARIFLGAVEEALDEFGRRVKLEMTCSCASVHDQLPERKSSRLGEFSVTGFKPVSFLEHLKYLAMVVSMPRLLDFTVTHNCLSAFYHSIGHRQLPMNALREKDETEEDKVSGLECNVAKEGFMSRESRKRKMKRDSEAKVEDIACEKETVIDKGFNSRERKKSKYLSYPYTDWEQKVAAGTEVPAEVLKVTPEASKVAGKSNALPTNFNGEKFWRKWYRRFTGVSQIPTALELKNATSAELLCELRSAAVDCLHPSGNNDFNPVCWFLSRFRISVFNEESVEIKANGAETCLSDNNAQENSHASQLDKTKRKRTKTKESSSQGEHTIPLSNAIASMETGIQNTNESLDQSSGQDSPMIKKNGKQNSPRLKTKPLSGLSDVSISFATNGVSERDALGKGPALKHNKAKQRKKKKGEQVNGDHLQTKQMTSIPDLNGNSAASSLLVDDPQALNHVTSKVKTKLLKEVEKGTGLKANPNAATAGLLNIHENNAKPGTPVVHLRVPGEASACLNNDCTADVQDFAKEGPTSGLPLGDVKPVTIGLLLGEGKLGRKKRKRKEKEAPKNIPDLNRASAESDSLGKETQETDNGLTPPVKPKRKRRKRKEQVALQYPRNMSLSWMSDYLSYYRTETNGDTIGTCLLLTFAPGVPMPSREDLVSTFCKFGPLKESETRLLKNPGSAAQIVFMKSSDAAEALKNLEENNPFGAALVNYRLHHLPGVSRMPEANRTLGATQASSTQAPATPPLDFIRHNLQRMTSMLEISGNSLSPEMRAKLEGEIKGLLSKVSSMAGSGS